MKKQRTNRQKVVICVPTFRRPDTLRQLLASLSEQQFRHTAPDVAILVVDNDAETPLSGNGRLPRNWCRHPVSYVVEKERGVAAVRNRILDSIPADADFIALIDDDEIATPYWLDSLLTTQRDTRAVVVHGPVIPRFESPVPQWMKGDRYFELGPFEEGERLNYAGSGNSLICWPAVRNAGLRFDMRFNLTGGEDEDFFERLRTATGGFIVASRDGAAFETIPAARARASWVLKRRFRQGNTLGRIAMIRRRRRMMRLVKAVGRMARGAVFAFGGACFSRQTLMRGLTDLAWGIGTLIAFVNVRFEEYGNAAGVVQR